MRASLSEQDFAREGGLSGRAGSRFASDQRMGFVWFLVGGGGKFWEIERTWLPPHDAQLRKVSAAVKTSRCTLCPRPRPRLLPRSLSFRHRPRRRIMLRIHDELHARVPARRFAGVDVDLQVFAQREGLGAGAGGDFGWVAAADVFRCGGGGVGEVVAVAEEEVVEGAEGEDLGVGVVDDVAVAEGDGGGWEAFCSCSGGG